jgi:hypothetical protein
VRSVQAACRLGGARRVKVETVERVCRKVLGTDPRELYGEAFVGAWQHRGKRVDARVQALTTAFPTRPGTGSVARRQDEQRWCAAGTLNAERSFRRLKGYRQMPTFVAALARPVEAVTPAWDAGRVA